MSEQHDAVNAAGEQAAGDVPDDSPDREIMECATESAISMRCVLASSPIPPTAAAAVIGLDFIQNHPSEKQWNMRDGGVHQPLRADVGAGAIGPVRNQEQKKPENQSAVKIIDIPVMPRTAGSRLTGIRMAEVAMMRRKVVSP